MIVVPFLPIHLSMLRKSPFQPDLKFLNLNVIAKETGDIGEAYTVIDNGTVVACGGLIPHPHGRAVCWAIMGRETVGRMGFITKAVLRFLKTAKEKFDRIEVVVNGNFTIGNKWAKMLGFTKESEMPKYAKGETYVMYSIVRNDD